MDGRVYVRLCDIFICIFPLWHWATHHSPPSPLAPRPLSLLHILRHPVEAAAADQRAVGGGEARQQQVGRLGDGGGAGARGCGGVPHLPARHGTRGGAYLLACLLALSCLLLVVTSLLFDFIEHF